MNAFDQLGGSKFFLSILIFEISLKWRSSLDSTFNLTNKTLLEEDHHHRDWVLSSMASIESSQNPSIVDSNANHDVELITIFSITMFLSLAAVFARLASTKINRVKYGLEEGLIVIAWV